MVKTEPQSPFSILRKYRPLKKRTKNEKPSMEKIYLKFEDCVFAVPKKDLLRQGIFATMFAVKPEPGEPVVGLTEDSPLIIPDIPEAAFRAFLKVLHPLEIPPHYDSIHLVEWISILRIATMWGFKDIRKLAIERMENMPDGCCYMTSLDYLIHGGECHVREWFRRGCVAIIDLEEPIDVGPAESMGLEIAIRLCKLREERLRRGRSFCTESAVEQEFENELDIVSKDAQEMEVVILKNYTSRDRGVKS
ncbi:hypothetical protein EST38_g2715 [Candolleomyces aberdarensis]|uniref:BTB domain-containing protein n=1 Tax=Candolleomyces aberdarensis TaxID=2316362 RepID=A0A4Q2DTU8_9AGAR|nr:hypothetical protein EST38_g2715 [Candolleomyces aberdarensis]